MKLHYTVDKKKYTNNNKKKIHEDNDLKASD